MQAFKSLDTLACPLDRSNIDTDQLIPARFMKEPRSVGYGQFLLHDLRFNAEGQANPDFLLNYPGAETCEVLVAKRNFGGGSSREAAVYALVDYGFRCVLAPSFGDIFASNAVNNGLLPALVSEADCEKLFQIFDNKLTRIQIDLRDQCISCCDLTFPFDINPVWKTKLLNGWDDIDLTQGYRKEIDTFLDRYHQAKPWTKTLHEGNEDLIIRAGGQRTP